MFSHFSDLHIWSKCNENQTNRFQDKTYYTNKYVNWVGFFSEWVNY